MRATHSDEAIGVLFPWHITGDEARTSFSPDQHLRAFFNIRNKSTITLPDSSFLDRNFFCRGESDWHVQECLSADTGLGVHSRYQSSAGKPQSPPRANVAVPETG